MGEFLDYKTSPPRPGARWRSTLAGAHVLCAAAADFPGGREGAELTVEFTLLGQSFLGLNGGPNFKANEAVSFMVLTNDQHETEFRLRYIESARRMQAVVPHLVRSFDRHNVEIDDHGFLSAAQ
jgi:hypothetical protein